MWIHSGTVVLDAVSFPSGPLDLSSIVGEAQAIVLFKATEAGQGEFGGTRSIRLGGNLSNASADYLEFTPFRLTGYLIGITNSSGVILVSGHEIITLEVVGYTTAQFESETVFGPAKLVVENIDVSSILSGNTLAFFNWQQSSGSDTSCKTKISSDQADSGDGINACNLSLVGLSGMTICPTDEGSVTIVDPNAGTEQVDLVAIIGSELGWTRANDIVFTGSPLDEWRDIDLSSVTGAKTVLAVLQVLITPDYEATDQYFAFKSKSDTSLDSLPVTATGLGSCSGHSNFGQSFYACVETDNNGVIQWIGSIGYDVEITLLGYIDSGSSAPALYVDSATGSYLSTRVTFSSAVVNDSELRNPLNYTIIPLEQSTSVGAECISVIPDSLNEYPEYVDLEVTDCTNDSDYAVVVTPNRIRNSNDDFIGNDGNTAIYVAVSLPPGILLSFSTSETTYKVVFTKPMAINADLSDPRNYQFNDGLRCTKVTVESQTVVILTTTKQTRGHIYNLTIG